MADVKMRVAMVMREFLARPARWVHGSLCTAARGIAALEWYISKLTCHQTMHLRYNSPVQPLVPCSRITKKEEDEAC